MTCYLCDDDNEVQHLPLYVNGSEGVMLCLQCRMVLTELVSRMANMATHKAVKTAQRLIKER
jgi:hypothetical protein